MFAIYLLFSALSEFSLTFIFQMLLIVGAIV